MSKELRLGGVSLLRQMDGNVVIKDRNGEVTVERADVGDVARFLREEETRCYLIKRRDSGVVASPETVRYLRHTCPCDDCAVWREKAPEIAFFDEDGALFYRPREPREPLHTEGPYR